MHCDVTTITSLRLRKCVRLTVFMFVCSCVGLLNRTCLLRLLRTKPAERDMAAAASNSEDPGRSSSGSAGGSGTTSGLGGDGDSEEAEEFSSSSHCSELSRRQNEQRKHGLFCDVTLVFSRGSHGESDNCFELMAHRSVLSAATDYFSPLLGGQYAESLSGRVEMKEWSSETGPDQETVESVVQFMYTGEIRVSTANIHEVLELADR